MSYTIKFDNYVSKYTCLIFGVVFSLALSSLPVDAFVDRDNYLIYASSPTIIAARYLAGGFSDFIFNEPLWLLINIILSFFLTPDWVLRTIIFFSSFITIYTVLSNIKLGDFLIVILFLLLPLVLKNYIIHLRQGFAISFFLLGWFSIHRNLKYSLFICAALIHSSFIIVLFGVLFTNIFLFMKLSSGIRFFLFIFMGLFVGFFTLSLASLLGARQGSGYQISAETSGLGFVFWGLVTILFMLQNKTFLQKHAHSLLFLILYLCTYFILPVTARILESSLMIILISTLDFNRKYKYCFVMLYLLLFIALWVDRLPLPGFGWGIENYI